MTSRRTAISLFSGCGGFCEGVDLAGFEIKAAVEYDKYACQTYRANFPNTPLMETSTSSLSARMKRHIGRCADRAST
jgi:DNA (cytosine-5)-methyltransferase 1